MTGPRPRSSIGGRIGQTARQNPSVLFLRRPTTKGSVNKTAEYIVDLPHVSNARGSPSGRSTATSYLGIEASVSRPSPCSELLIIMEHGDAQFCPEEFTSP